MREPLETGAKSGCRVREDAPYLVAAVGAAGEQVALALAVAHEPGVGVVAVEAAQRAVGGGEAVDHQRRGHRGQHVQLPLRVQTFLKMGQFPAEALESDDPPVSYWVDKLAER